jgi:hypothetical protein
VISNASVATDAGTSSPEIGTKARPQETTGNWPGGVDALADHIYGTCHQSSLGEGTADDPRNIAQAVLASDWLAARDADLHERILREAIDAIEHTAKSCTVQHTCHDADVILLEMRIARATGPAS